MVKLAAFYVGLWLLMAACLAVGIAWRGEEINLVEIGLWSAVILVGIGFYTSTLRRLDDLERRLRYLEKLRDLERRE